MISNRGEKDTIIVRNVLIAVVLVFIVFVLATHTIITEEKALANRIYPGVFINNIDVGKKSLTEVKKMLNKDDQELKKTVVTVFYEKQPIATFSAQQINLKTNGEEIAERAYLIGRTPHHSTRWYQKLSTLFGLTSFHFDTETVYDKGPINDFISLVEDQYNKPARNALFSFENGRVKDFRKEENGLKLNSEEFKTNFDSSVKSLKHTGNNKTVILSSSIVKPEVTLSEANSYGIEELIGEGKSDYSHSIPERIHNVILAASKFQGVLIPKDKEFSFNEVIGDISSLTGYKPAYVIKNGKTVLGDGGGVCQVSTTFFRAALNSGLPITERHAHAYRVGYYENDSKPGFDATIFSPNIDLKVKNDTPASILVMTEVDEENKLLYFRFYGKKDGRNVEISPVTLYDQQPPPPPLYQDDPTLKKGITKQVDYAAWGAKSKFDYKVTRGSDTIYTKTFVSVYRPWQAVYLVGQAD